MNTSDTRVTREQAAELAGVSVRQINRWSAAGLLTVEYGPVGARIPATYDREEVLSAKARWAEKLRSALLHESDIAT